jgi:phage shock protein A
MSTVTSALQTLKSSVDPLEERLAAVEGSLKPLSDSHPTLSQAVDELRSKMAEAAAAAEGQKAGASAEEVERLSKVGVYNCGWGVYVGPYALVGIG